MKITIIGSGMMGSALVFPAMKNGNTVNLVGTHLDSEIITACKKIGRHPKFERDFPLGVNYFQIEDVATAIEGSDFIICGVSSFGVDWFGENMLPIIPETTPILSVTKGLVCLDDGTLICYPEYWGRMDGGKHEICAIGGPCTSYELVAEDQTVVSFCGKNLKTLQAMKTAMATDYYHVNVTTDVMGIESAVALKNGYALGVAFSIGVNKRIHGEDSELHFNSQAGLFLQASREMTALIEFLGGGKDATFVGIGDLYVTIYGGRTRKLGVLLGKGLTLKEALGELSGVTLESTVVAGRVAKAIRIMSEKGHLCAENFPLLFHVDDVLSGKTPVDIPWEKFV
jgi:glycerol-3-phosphate dehydrogenase (NAD(P)+)